MNITHRLNRTVQHQRPIAVDDGAGGSTTTMLDLDPLPCRTSQPSATERLYAAQAQAEHTVPIYTDPDKDVRRGDELSDPATGEAWRVAATIRPSKAKYLRLDCELIQKRGGA